MDANAMLIEAAHRFSLACQLPCTAINENSETIYEDSSSAHKSLCACIMDTAPGTKRINCDHVHYYGCMQAMQCKGKYLYYCPMGLAHFIAPLVVHGKLLGALIGGPLIISDKEEYIRSAALERYSSNEVGKDSLQKLSDFFPSISPERITTLCELLMTLVKKIEAELSDTPEPHSMIIPFTANLREQDLYPLETEQQLLTAIRIGNSRAAATQLTVWLDQISHQELIKFNAYCCELSTLAARTAIDSGADEQLTLENSRQYIVNIQTSKTYEKTVRYVTNMISGMTSLVYELSSIRHSDSIFKALSYVNQNYAKKITLEDVSRAAFLSPTYFSRVFKDEMKVPFSQHLNRVRIDASKKLLETTNFSMGDICMRVGFEEQSYFTKVFKKLTGMTPLRYKEQNLLKKEAPSA